MKINKKIFLILLAGVLLPLSVYAQITVESIVDRTVQLALYIISGIVVILWLVTGFLFLTAQGDPGKFDKAKMALLASVAGTVLVIAAQGALNLVGSALGIQ